MPEIRPLTESDFRLIYETFLAGTVPGLTADHYRPMFVSTSDSSGPCGYGLFDGERLAGMLGTLVTPRVLGGRRVEICNLHSWFVQPEYRGYSLGLMRPVLKRKDWTLTDLSPSPAVCTISLRLGFEPLDGRLTLLFRPWRRRTEVGGAEVISDAAAILARTTNDDPTIRAAIGNPRYVPTLIVEGEEECLVLGRVVAGKRRRHVYVEYISHPKLFARTSLLARAALLDRTGAAFVAVETRRIAGQPPLPCRWRLPASTTQLIRRADIAPGDIDTLGSEASYLCGSFLPGKRLFAAAMTTKLAHAAAAAKSWTNRWRRAPQLDGAP